MPVVGWAVVPQSMRNGTRPSTGSAAPTVSRHASSEPCAVRRDIARGGPGSYPRALAVAMASSRSGGRMHQVTTRDAVRSSMPNGRGWAGSGWLSFLPRPSQKDKILQAALECFAELGYDDTRVRHVADRAGVSEGALYRHYPSMEALAQELYAHHFGGFAAQLREATSTGTTEQRLRQAIRTTLANGSSSPPGAPTAHDSSRSCGFMAAADQARRPAAATRAPGCCCAFVPGIR